MVVHMMGDIIGWFVGKILGDDVYFLAVLLFFVSEFFLKLFEGCTLLINLKISSSLQTRQGWFQFFEAIRHEKWKADPGRWRWWFWWMSGVDHFSCPMWWKLLFEDLSLIVWISELRGSGNNDLLDFSGMSVIKLLHANYYSSGPDIVYWEYNYMVEPLCFVLNILLLFYQEERWLFCWSRNSLVANLVIYFFLCDSFCGFERFEDVNLVVLLKIWSTPWSHFILNIEGWGGFSYVFCINLNLLWSCLGLKSFIKWGQKLWYSYA